MSKTIVLFNHKGGVSKTTTTFHLAWKLTQKKKKVLLIDGDPQCNLTGIFLGENFDQYYENPSTQLNNIKDAVSQAFNGRPMPIRAINCPEHIYNSNLWIVPGHMDLSEYESSLSLALNSGNVFSALQNLPGSFYELIKCCSKKYNIDYIFIDMNPGLSALNQTFFMYADGFIVPTNPDPFSLMALKTLRKTLPRWKKIALDARKTFQKSSYPLPETKMLFIGEIIQRFNIRNGQPATPYKDKINDIKEYIETGFSQEMEKNKMAINLTPVIKRGLIKDHCIGEISDFGALIQKANKAHKPVFALTQKDMETIGNVYDAMEEKRSRINSIFENMASIVMELLV